LRTDRALLRRQHRWQQRLLVRQNSHRARSIQVDQQLLPRRLSHHADTSASEAPSCEARLTSRSHLANFLVMIVGGAAQEMASAVRRKLQGRRADGR
jgi:hypothetical protein